jgi:glycosyltransferase involved in cell wall biosynthesis
MERVSMKNMPLVSILINNYNYAIFLQKSIDSALNQTYSPVEVIVVDDGSTDNSTEIIRSYGNLIVPVMKKNGGQASAFNAGFKASKGEIVCFLDADDYYFPSKICQIVNFFQENNNADWLFHQLDDVDINGNDLELNRNDNISKFSFVDLREKIFKGHKLPLFPATSALCFKRDVLQRFFPIPEQLLISADNFLRLAAISLSPGLLLPAKLAVHRIHGKNLFEFRPDGELIDAEINIKTCYYLRKLFPKTQSYTNIIYSHSVGQLAGKANLLKVLQIPESQKYIKQYFSLKFGLTGGIRILYNYIKAIIPNLNLTLKHQKTP